MNGSGKPEYEGPVSKLGTLCACLKKALDGSNTRKLHVAVNLGLVTGGEGLTLGHTIMLIYYAINPCEDGKK